ncbi:dihydropteroate synthase [Kineococcus glutinatus]|uniref:Dihydropteroate synthase n=1 Tax=Kineococcus glutinatus TaxID=1070872 RepID=A0ABP9HP38_9ACTN
MPATGPEALLAPGRCRVVGVLNVTPDSFSDGGRWPDARAACAHGLAMVAAGADLVDVGGESTRPGAQRVDAAEEARRVLPVVEGLVAAGVAVSVDTMRAQVAARALAAGALVVNDVSGGRADARMAAAVADAGALFVVSHWRGHSDVMTSRAVYGDVVAEVVAELGAARDAAVAAGVAPGRVVLDPGLGFAKVGVHDWALLRALPALRALGHPVLVGASRKRFLGALLAGSDGTAPPAAERDAATAAVSALAAAAGAWGVRVHDVASSAAAVRVAAAWADPAAERPGAGVPS